MPFLVPPKTPILGLFGYFEGTKKGTWGARIKILRPLFNTNTEMRSDRAPIEFQTFYFFHVWLDPPNSAVMHKGFARDGHD